MPKKKKRQTLTKGKTKASRGKGRAKRKPNTAKKAKRFSRSKRKDKSIKTFYKKTRLKRTDKKIERKKRRVSRRIKIEQTKRVSKKTKKPKSVSKKSQTKTSQIKEVSKKKSSRLRKGKVAYQANKNFELYNELRALLIKASPESFPKIKKGFKRMGRINLVVVTGSFLNLSNARVDMLVVGDGISLNRFTEFIKKLEAEMGRELRYVILSRDEFTYRHTMQDRFLKDILEYPNQKIINRLKI